MKMMLSLAWLLIAIAHKAKPFISEHFNECREFFYKGQLPDGFDDIALPHHINHPNLPDGIKERNLASPAYICQQYKNDDRFASLYDRGRRVPLYSAYILDRRSASNCSDRKNTFDVEPQLVDRALNKAMLRESATTREIQIHFKLKNIQEAQERLRTSQAVNADYGIAGFHRGHLNPVCHHEDKDAQDATFTLTNAVPMDSSLNQGQWRIYEKQMIAKARDCNTMYVVTGIVPGNNWIKNDRVNIPSQVWSAYCCVGNNDKPIGSGAGLANNINYSVTELNVTELELQLQRLIQNIPFSIFHNKCS
ncbi:hypothetical protein XENTR_v10009797 [Xenopus tropicalis]|uniref:Endonuclease domain-containing 1 protein n=1 Tax=Xenopus tropicalis TaxID=8364 RepID=A0A6I8RPP6_XENTR|nr:endonuclease domain-containing 1 protein [Xenopus tropicalis]KAE8619464.1 hypothetical protein XENTR_v10009797 [Xenopus tropicalis]|eukprot:XP_002932825.1 PREDICTED: endonuclease domain-containing 1 protein-like [Xenopus tropicalis]